MRKLLVASQKGGVGKTTASMNLAASAARAGTRVLLLDADPLSSISVSLNLNAHAQRQSLRQAGIDLPGAMVCDVVPGVDVLSPYDEGCCTDADFDEVLRLLEAPAIQNSYGTAIFDAPPFLGANPGQLVRACDEFILVMRAEPMAYRTLPAFLELVQRNRATEHGIQMRGILLTLNEGEPPGDRWERELRGRFGTRILPHVIPYADEVGQSVLFGQIHSHTNPESVVAREYASLAKHLGLCPAKASPLGESKLVSLLLSAVATAPVRRVPVVNGSGVHRGPNLGRNNHGSTALLELGDDADNNPDEQLRQSPVPEPLLPDLESPVEPAPVRRHPPVSPRRSGLQRPARPRAVRPPEGLEEIEPITPVAPSRVDSRKSGQRTAAVPPAPKPAPKRKSQPAKQPDTGGNTLFAILAILAAAGIGMAFGMAKNPEAMLPGLVGIGVTFGGVLLLRLTMTGETPAPRQKTKPRQVAETPQPGPGSRQGEPRRTSSGRPQPPTRRRPLRD